MLTLRTALDLSRKNVVAPTVGSASVPRDLVRLILIWINIRVTRIMLKLRTALDLSRKNVVAPTVGAASVPRDLVRLILIWINIRVTRIA